MNELSELLLVDGDILATMVRLFIFSFALDFVLTFARTIMQIGNSAKS